MIKFELVTPERVVFRTEVDKITLPTKEGEITILPHHAALVAELVAGVAHLTRGTAEEDVAVSGGFIQVGADNRVRVLADTAERGVDLDLGAIEQATARAEAVMKETARTDDSAFAAAAASLERELARSKVARKMRTMKHVPTLDAAVLPPDENPV
ncbi:ATP synthase F1 subunit epsilon [Patescibacteria group bacterium]|nr:ATP synthase F1 subunit epsilon [Patescibacteria group bacterium]